MSFKVKIVLISLCMPFYTSCGINSKPVERNRRINPESAGETVSDYASRESVPSVG